jgi:hypothetical protein
VRGGPAIARALLLTAACAAAAAGEARAQRAAWTDVVYVPGEWSGGRIVARPDSLALVMRIDYFSAPPKWRAEIRRSNDGRTLGDPDILIGQGRRTMVVTPLGATPLEQHALAREPLITAAVVFDQNGRRAGPASGRITERAADGRVSRVVFRRVVRNARFDDKLLDAGNRASGRTLLASGIAAVGDQRSASVVATAGARGVDRVQTPQGSVPVRPDTAAVSRMEHFAVGAVTLEDFLRAGGLGPYAPARSDAGGRPQ